MPTNLLLAESSFDGFESVLATLEGVRSPRMITLDLDAISPDRNGKKYVQPGTMIVKRADGKGVPYKTGKLAAAVTTSATSLTVNNASLFQAGDALTLAQPYARIDLGGTWANADTATVNLAGQTVTHTVASYTNLTALALAIAATLTSSALSQKATFIAEGQYIHVFGSDNLPIVVAKTGSGTFALDGSAINLQSGLTVETIASIDVVTNTLTLAGAADRRLPAGAAIGVSAGTDLLWGMVVSPIDVSTVSNDVACYTSCTVYGDRLPVWNGYLQRQFPEITLL